MRPLPVRLRKLIGASSWSPSSSCGRLLAMALAQAVALRGSPIIEFAYYAIAGLGWVLPAMPLVAGWRATRHA